MASERWLKVGVMLLAGFGYACSGNQTGQESLPAKCEETETATGLDEATSLGFSANEFAHAARKSFTSEARFFKSGKLVDMTLALGEASQASFVQSSGDPTACTDHLDIDTMVTAGTADGALAEEFPATVRVRMLDLWSLSQDLRLSQLVGSYDASDHDLTGWKEPVLQLTARVERTTLLGVLWLSDAAGSSASSRQSTSAMVAEWPAAR